MTITVPRIPKFIFCPKNKSRRTRNESETEGCEQQRKERNKERKKVVHSRHDNKTNKIVANLEKAYTY